MDEERLKWERERAKVRDEWSEIELKAQHGHAPQPADVKMSLNPVGLVSFHGDSFMNIKNDVLRKILITDYTREKAQILEDERAEGPVQNNLGASFIRSCVCRPGNPDEPLKTSRLVEERLTLLALTLVNYSNNVPEHWKLLCELYRRATKSLTGESQECARIGGHWERIGFQGADPSTDFRSAGMLGLIQLHFFCTESVSDDILKEILTLSQDSVQNFPLAVVGINFTAQIIERLKKRMLNAISNSFESVFQTISLIYRGCLFEFCNRWRLNNCTIIDFHSNLTAIGRMMDKDPACLITVKYLPKFEQ